MFQLFGPDHLAALAAAASLCAAVSRWGRSATPRQRTWARRWLIAILIGYVAASYIRLGLTHRLTWSHSLPLHLCDLTLAACLVALCTRRPFACELCYFWGLAGTLPALLTPDLHDGFPSAGFVLFFLGHGLILLVNTWLIVAERRIPQPGSVRRAFLALNAYALVVGGSDAAFGWNYGYLCRRPSQPSLLDHLGPWPWYIVGADALAFAAFHALYLPWSAARNAGPRSGSVGGDPGQTR